MVFELAQYKADDKICPKDTCFHGIENVVIFTARQHSRALY